MPDPEYLPIPTHVYTLACALVTTRREEESPVVIRVEVLPCGDSDNAPVSSVAATIYPVTFTATYTMELGQHQEWTGQRHAVKQFTGWSCLHPVAGQSAGNGTPVSGGCG